MGQEQSNETDRRAFKELRFPQRRASVEPWRPKDFFRSGGRCEVVGISTWRQVLALEEALGVQLVDMQGYQIVLTEDGRLLVEMA